MKNEKNYSFGFWVFLVLDSFLLDFLPAPFGVVVGSSFSSIISPEIGSSACGSGASSSRMDGSDITSDSAGGSVASDSSTVDCSVSAVTSANCCSAS